jgi:two-component system, sporulation sensor kinase E
MKKIDRILSCIDTLDAVSLAKLVQLLAKERSFFEFLLKTITEGVIVVDAARIIVYANEAALSILGIQSMDVSNVSITQLVPEFARTLKRAAPVGMQEISLTYPQDRTVRAYTVPFDSEGPDSWAIILSDQTSDIREKMQLIEEGKLSSIMLLASSVAHEIGNPLNSIMIHLQLIAREVAKVELTSKAKEAVEHSLDVCTAEIDRLGNLLRHFLDAVRPSTPDLKELQLLELLAEVLKFQQAEIEDRGVRIELELGDGLPLVRADASKMKQVFFNLIKNAIEALGPGGRIRIHASNTDRDVLIAFEDNGIGITETDLPKILEPFYTTKASGNGLGLMIVQRILQTHGGTLMFESTPNAGTVVTVKLPLLHPKVPQLAGGDI